MLYGIPPDGWLDMTRAAFEDYVAAVPSARAQLQMARAEAATVGAAGRKAARSWWRAMERQSASVGLPARGERGVTHLYWNGQEVSVRQLASAFGTTVEGSAA